jgi:antitoxin HigA-1
MLPKNRPPTHPGEILLEEFLKPLGLSQDHFAKHLGGTWTQSKVSEIVTGKRGVTEAIALDFADALGTSPQLWMNLQTGYDLWFAQQEHKKVPLLKVKGVELCHLMADNAVKSATSRAKI